MTLATPRPDRHPQDWYVEPTWTVRALMQMIALDRDYTIWDPCCGLGTIPCALAAAGFTVAGTDLTDRWSAQTLGLPHLFLGEHDFLGAQRHMVEFWPLLSVIFNPPYSYEDDIAERCVRQALKVASGMVCALLPIRWRASEKRFGFLQEEFPPLEILEFCDRPSMPPGTALHDRDEKTGQLIAWKRGKTDYAWYVWDRHRPRPDTRSRLIPPRTRAQKIADRDHDLRRVGALPQLELAA
ncbi:TRM11 family methyltransferase [Sphingobium cloacae]|uniref:Methyltransferase n=1 Tax=Sphingobium cloacae TaxID=120107 RepID=A0A1E1F2N7_9SPHN|nr:hypothetical protein [Sphingobium cloacae]BAV64788.1 hypothetical protein SCLO_1017480 [Sphingobium cloacae]